MLNPCINRLYFLAGSRTLRDSFAQSIRETFNCRNMECSGGKAFVCETEFESEETFPEKEMKELTDTLPMGNGVYIHVRSYEYGCEHVEINVYSCGEWNEKFVDEII
jgi:hypothetical protein